MNSRERVARNLAAALLAGAWTPSALLSRASEFLGRPTQKSQRLLIQELLDSVPTAYPPSPSHLVGFFLGSRRFDRASARLRKKGAHIPAVLQPASFSPTPRFAEFDIPRLATPGDLADWLKISIEQIAWFADARDQQRRTSLPVLRHYAYAFAPKRSGPPRLLESPKPRLKAIQRQILRGILDHVPVHDCAHGFVRRRSCLTSAQVHAGEALVVALDLKDFFLRTPLRRVHGLFRSLGYPWAVARFLTGLSSTATPQSIFLVVPEHRRHDWQTRKIYESPHLPQGAPTSPSLANFAAWHLDVRLQGLAASLDANYTRYADDLVFSGGELLAHRCRALLAAVEEIARDEGYALNKRKTRIMRRAGRQRLTGLVVNDHLNVARADYDALKATLHNCLRNGPQAGNRSGRPDFRAHLEGRVGWVENVNRRRGERLRRMFDGIKW
jgi:RNA-directed DNA polymerase